MSYTTPTISAAQQRTILSVAGIASSKCAFAYTHKHGLANLFTKEDVEDIAGTVAYKACRSFGRYDPNKAKLSTWVSSIAANCVLDAAAYKLKRIPISYALYAASKDDGDEYEVDEYCDGRRGFNPEVWDLLSENESDKDLISKEFLSSVRSECANLSERNQRYEFWLEDGYGPKDMAAADNCTPNAAAKRVFTIRQELSEPLAKLAGEYGLPFKRKAC